MRIESPCYFIQPLSRLLYLFSECQNLTKLLLLNPSGFLSCVDIICCCLFLFDIIRVFDLLCSVFTLFSATNFTNIYCYSTYCSLSICDAHLKWTCAFFPRCIIIGKITLIRRCIHFGSTILIWISWNAAWYFEKNRIASYSTNACNTTHKT